MSKPSSSKPSLKNIEHVDFLIGAGYALRNSYDLYNDGALLLKNERYSRAYTLFQLGMEEAGKVILLMEGFVIIQIYNNSEYTRSNSDIEVYYKKLNDVFYGHQGKMKYILEFELGQLNGFFRAFKLPSDAGGIGSTRNQVKEDLKNISTFDKMKNESLYTFIETNKFIHPTHKFNLETTNGLKHKAFSKIQWARTKYVDFLKGREIPKEIDIKEFEKLKLDIF